MMMMMIIIIIHLFCLDGCQQFSLTSPSCPGSSNITYTCVLSGPGAYSVISHYYGSAFNCSAALNRIILLQRIAGINRPFTRVSCGNLSAVTTNINSGCYTSVLTIPIVQALNGATVSCNNDGTGTVVGTLTLNTQIASELHTIT